MNMGRVAAMKAGLPIEVPGQTINRFCSSGLQTIAMAAERVMCGFADCIIAGGAESMSSVPMGGNEIQRQSGAGVRLARGLLLPWASPPSWWRRNMASAVRTMDDFAAASHAKAAAAIESGRFKDEIIPVEIEKDIAHGWQDQTSRRRRSRWMTACVDRTPPGNSCQTASGLQGRRSGDGRQLLADDRRGGGVPGGIRSDFFKKIGKDPFARFVAFAVKGVASGSHGHRPH